MFFVFLLAMSLIVVGPGFANKPVKPQSGSRASVSHSVSTTHQMDPADESWDGPYTFRSTDGTGHLSWAYFGIQFNGGVIDDGAEQDFLILTPITLTDPSGLGYREHTFAEYTGTGYTVSQYTYTNDTADGDDWVIYELTITNTSGAPLNSG